MAVALAVAAMVSLQLPLYADRYEDTVAQAEKLWTEGRKVEAVRMYGEVWGLNPQDVDRQILYGERSAEVGNFRWAINFFRVAEPKAEGNPTRLGRICEGYARTYRMAGRPDLAVPWDKKAKALRGPETGKGLIPQKAPTADQSVEQKTTKPAIPPAKIELKAAPTVPAPAVERIPPSVTVLRKPVVYLKKRIVVAPIGVAVRDATLAAYSDQLHARLIAELRKTNRFIVVAPEALGDVPVGQDSAAAGRTGALAGVHLVVRCEITELDDRSASRTRVAMGIRIQEAASGVVVASDSVSAEKAVAGNEVRVDAASFRFDDPRSQDSPLGLVTRELIQQALEKILAHLAKVAWTARVINVDGNEIVFDAGSAMGVRVGDQFKVVSGGDVFADRKAVELLSPRERPIGDLEVVTVEETSSTGRVSGIQGEIRRGDKVVEILK